MPDQRTTPLDAQVARLVSHHRMLVGVRRLGVAVSGGADSVALLRLLLPLCRTAGITPVVLHFDHGLRGAASAADARFVAQLARKLEVKRRMGSAKHQATNGASLEMAARAARQAFFRKAAQQECLDAIATGHTADDVAETLLLRLARGSGATGLSGLRPVHTVAGVRFVRPLLDCTHNALCAGLRAQRQTWREDASNNDEHIPRNLLRHTVIPWLERHWAPTLRSMLVQSAAILRDEDALLEELARQAMGRSGSRTVGRLDLRASYAVVGEKRRRTTNSPSATPHPPPTTLHLPPSTPSASSGHECLHLPPATIPIALQRRILRQWLLDAGHAEAAGWREIETILTRLREPTPWQISLPGSVRVRKTNSRLELVPSATRKTSQADQTNETTLPVPGNVTVAGVQVMAQRVRGIVRTSGLIGKLPSACSLDAAALRGKTLQVRTRRPGDRIRPLGLRGSKSLQDLLVDAKVPVMQRNQLPLLAVDGEVVWVPGYRVAEKYAVRGPQAKAVRVEMRVDKTAEYQTRNSE